MTHDDIRAELAQLRDDAAILLEAYLARPVLRGMSHVVAFFVALAAGAVLVLQATATIQVAASVVYGVGLSAALGTSALYHRIRWRPRAYTWVRNLDHSMIFVLVASSYTPFLMLALDGPWRVWSMIAVWTFAGVGVTMRLSITNLPRAVSVSSYLAIGWAAVLLLPKLLDAVPRTSFGLLVAGGLLYSVGAAVYLFKRPDPLPRIFGFHEVFHGFVVAAAVCHFVAVWPLVTSALPSAA